MKIRYFETVLHLLRPELRFSVLTRVSIAVATGFLAIFALSATAQAQSFMPAAAAKHVEAGVPLFGVFSPDAIGLNGLPNGIHLLPDGRVLVTSESELAFGDGVRWEVFRAAEGQSLIYRDVLVDQNNAIYLGIEGGIARIELGSDGLWRTIPAVSLPEPLAHTSLLYTTDIAGDSYWWGGGGPIAKWRPGQQVEVIPNRVTIERLFKLGGDLYASEQSSGGLYCLTKAGSRVTAIERLTSELITAVVPFDDRTMLVATGFSGLRLFDGTTIRPFEIADITAGGSRINDLCAVGQVGFAAAVDTRGIVFFDRHGKVLQMLDAKLDHRLARVQKLRYSADGVLWGMLNEGVVRVEFPSAVSRIEPMITSGLSYAAPYRYRGDLWLIAEGRALRGVYDRTGRLDQFVPDSPPGRFVFTIGTIDDEFFGCTDAGIFVRDGRRWVPVAPGVVNARTGLVKTPNGAVVYAARGEIGTVTKTGEGYQVHRIEVPELGDSYNARVDAKHVVWLELGNGHVGRLDPNGAEPTLRVLGPGEGLEDGWPSISIFDGIARVQVQSHFYRYDEGASRFVPDVELLNRFPQFATASSRLETDPSGRIWYTAAGRTWRIDPRSPNPKPELVNLPLPPLEYWFQSDGVLWYRGNHAFQRYDPTMPTIPRTKPRAIVTALQFPNSNRQVFDLRHLGAIPYSDNTIVFHFAAPSNPFTGGSTFQVQLEGANDRWVPGGNTGQIVFNRLKEGRYTFHVRTISESGETSSEGSVDFIIQPPWFRTPLAWTAYGVGGIGLLAFMIWYPSVRQRRENERLERLVTKRTEELNNTNQQLGVQIAETTAKSKELAVSEERYRTLSAELEHRVDERTAELSTSNQELQQRESLFRLIFEHAPVGISWKRADLDNLHHFNGTYRRILDLPSETLTDYTLLSQRVHPDDAANQVEMNERIVRGEIDSYRIEARFVLESGRQVWGSWCVAVVRDPAGRILQEIGILEDITARKEAEKQLAATYKELVDASRMAGMAEVATGVLHNVGNVLNSLNVSSNLIATTVRQSKVESLVKLSALLHERAGDLAHFLTQDPKGRLVPELLDKLSEAASSERAWLLSEIASMQKNIDHIKDIVAMQQSYATVMGVTETLAADELFNDALRMNTAALTRHDVRVVKEFQPVPPVCVEKGKVLQILINIIRNAKYACDDGQQFGEKEKVITVRLEATGNERVRFIVRDNGVGIASENLTRIFAHGFTTRAYGHGFGLHSSALAAREMKGSLVAASDGVGKGATFILEIPAATALASATGNTNSPIAMA